MYRMNMDDDNALVEHALREPEGYRMLYRKYLKPVYRYVYARTGDASEAEDLVSQVFLAAWEALPGYRRQGSFAAWLFAIARRKIADYYRGRRPTVPVEALENSLKLSHTPLDGLVEAEELRQLAQLVDGLDEAERELLHLRFGAELSFDQMAALLKRKPSAVKMSVYRLLEYLRACLLVGHSTKEVVK